MTTATGSLTFALSRLARPAAGEGFDDIRLAMVDRLIEASGNGTLDGAAWLQHWQAAATEMTDRIMTTAADQVEIAAARSRMSAARAKALMPGASDRSALLNRLLAEGTALEELEHGQQPDLRRGAALDEAWDRAIAVAARERARWTRVAAEAGAWRRPWRPLLIVSGALLMVVVLLAAMLGGIVDPPQWFEPVNDWFWALPWP